MKLTLSLIPALAALGLALAFPAAAQDDNSARIVVPPQNGVRARLVKVTAQNAGITVRTHAGNDIIVESADGVHRRHETTPDGLHRIDVPRGVVVSQEGDTVDIRISSGEREVVVSVPTEISLQLKSSNGAIRVDGVHGEVDASTTNGALNLVNVSGTIVADTSNGALHASMDRVDPARPISFSSVNGSVDVTLPADLKADFKMRTVNGSIWTDFAMRLPAGQPAGRREVLNGSVNGGGVPATFSTVNGRITIRKK